MNEAKVTARAQAIYERLSSEQEMGKNALLLAACVIAELEASVSYGLVRADPPEPENHIGKFNE